MKKKHITVFKTIQESNDSDAKDRAARTPVENWIIAVKLIRMVYAEQLKHLVNKSIIFTPSTP